MMPATLTSGSDSRIFLESSFADKPENLYLLLWEKLPESKRSYWFKNVEKAALFAASHPVNLYVGVALSPADFGLHKRCTTEQTAGLVGLYTDLDIAGAGHKSEKLPSTEADALTLLPPEFPPTFIIDSGHGLQAWWLFKEPWVFADDEDRARAQELTRAWGRCIDARAAAKGLKVDAVFDLARVMRLPGTTNRKEWLPDVEARIISTNDIRYNPSDFEELLVTLPAPVRKEGKPAANQTPAPSVVDIASQGATQVLQHVDPLLLLGWAVERVQGGETRNATGFLLCQQARDNRYSYAEAVALGPQYVKLVAGHGNHPYELAEFTASLKQAYLQPPREPWSRRMASEEAEDEEDNGTGDEIQVAARPAGDAQVPVAQGTEAVAMDRTEARPTADGSVEQSGGPNEKSEGRMLAEAAVEQILKARALRAEKQEEATPACDGPEDEEEDEEEERDDQVGSPAGTDGTKKVTEEQKLEARATVLRLLKLHVVKVEKHGLVKGTYRLHLRDKSQFDIGDAKILDSQTAFRVAVIDGLNRQIPRLTRKRWDIAVSAMLKLVETVDTLTPQEMVADELQSYLNESGWFCTSLDDLRTEPEEMVQFMSDVKRYGAIICEKAERGRVILSLRSFVAWVHRHSKTNLTALEFASALSRMGFRKISTIASATHNGKRVRLNRVWVADRASLPLDVVDDRGDYLMRAQFEVKKLPVRKGQDCIATERVM